MCVCMIQCDTVDGDDDGGGDVDVDADGALYSNLR